MGGDGIIQILLIGIIIIIVVLLAVLAYLFLKEKAKKEVDKVEDTTEKTTEEKANRKSVFRFMEFDSIEDNMIIQDSGTRFLMVIECKGINYDLLSGLEKNSVEQGFLQFLNSLKFEIQLYVQTRKVNLNQCIISYKDRLEKIREGLIFEERKLEDMQRVGNYTKDEILKQIKEVAKKRNLYEYGEDLINNTEQMSNDKDVTTKQYYIIIPYYTEEITSTGDYDKREISSMAFSELYTRAQAIASGLSECDVRGRILNSQELIELLYVAYNREQHDIYDFETYMSETGYESLYYVSEDVLEKRMKALDEEIIEKAKMKAVTAFEMASEDLVRRKNALKEKEKNMQEYIDNTANRIVDADEEAIGTELANLTRENLKKMNKKEVNKDKSESHKRKLTEEERRRRLAIKRRKLRKEMERNVTKQKESNV